MNENCPHCGATLPRVADPFCPQCREEIDAPESTVSQDVLLEADEIDIVQEYPDGLTTGEQIYSALVLVGAGLYLIPLASFHFLIIPKSEDPGSLYLVVSIFWAMVLVLTVTTVINLCYRTLSIIPTILQCVALALSIYYIPLAIWGARLLYRRVQQSE